MDIKKEALYILKLKVPADEFNRAYLRPTVTLHSTN